MNSQIYLWEITRYLAWFTSQVRIENKNGNLDINKYAEGFLIPLLNQVFKKEFQRLEFVKQNYPAIDLGSTDNKISIQVTSEIGFDKIKNTITKYIENKLFIQYPELYHLVINEDYKTTKTDDDISEHIAAELAKTGINPLPTVEFKIENNLINISILRGLIEKNCDLDQLKEIRDYLEKQYGKVTSLPYFDDILVPYEIAFKAQLDVSNDNLPYQFHTPFFGRESDIDKLEDFLAELNQSVFVIIADGGYGKTRLAVEIFKKHAKENDKFEAYVLNEAAFQSMDFAEQLKTQKQVLILFDDAHNRPEILNDVIGVAQRLDNVKLILTIRKAVYSDTIRSVSSHRRVMETLELTRLNYEETQQLFKAQLIGLKDFEIKRLADESRGVPIVVLGLCQITLKGKYKSELSEEANFVHFVKELKEQVISDIHQKYYTSKENINKTIQLISFFSPIKNTPDEIAELSKLNEISVEKTNLILDYLFEYDFINKHNEISIKPDPYSDTILLDSAQRIKYLLQKNLNVFIDRLIRNLVEVEQSQRLDLSIDNLLFEFVSSFKNKPTGSNEDIKVLESNLDTLKSFTYKKPQICYLAVSHLISSQLDNVEFWRKEKDFDIFSNSFKTIHESIETILSIVAINTHKISEFDSSYDLLKLYRSKKPESLIFQKVFGYRIYDFYEYGYRPIKPCERQQYLVNKLNYRIENEEFTEDLFNHIFSSCKTLLVHDFEGESHYDKYTHSISFGRHHVIFNETTKNLREDAINLLIRSYEQFRFSSASEKCLEELIRILFYMAKPRREEYQLNQDEEMIVVVDYFQHILNNNPSIFERSSIIKQLKLFERRELKEDYTEISQKLLELAEKVETPKEKLELIFYDEYFSIRNNIDEIFKNLINQYNDWDLFYADILDIKSNLASNDYSNFHEIISQFVKNYKPEAKALLEFVLKNKPEQVCDFSTLIRANYEDQKYFYETINKIWNLEYDCVKGSVLWILTNGRNRDINFYKAEDLDFVEYVIEQKLVQALWSISFTLPKYILINPERTLNLIARILKISENRRENEHLIHSIFEDKEILDNYPDLIRNFIFKETLSIPLDSYYFNKALNFLEDVFGFDTLLGYLKEKILLLEKQKDYFSLSLHKHYTNPSKDSVQAELDFLQVINWYSELTEKSEYLHKKFVEYLRPTQINSEEFKNGFKQLIVNAGNEKTKVIDLCNALDVYEHKNEFLIAMLIEISNELCDKFELSNENLVQIFGSNFIYNMGVKSGPAGGPFPQDLNKRDELNQLMEKYPMHPRVKDIFTYSLDKVNKDIARNVFGEFDEKW